MRHSGHNPSFLTGLREYDIYFEIYLTWFGIHFSPGTILSRGLARLGDLPVLVLAGLKKKILWNENQIINEGLHICHHVYLRFQKTTANPRNLQEVHKPVIFQVLNFPENDR